MIFQRGLFFAFCAALLSAFAVESFPAVAVVPFPNRDEVSLLVVSLLDVNRFWFDDDVSTFVESVLHIRAAIALFA